MVGPPSDERGLWDHNPTSELAIMNLKTSMLLILGGGLLTGLAWVVHHIHPETSRAAWLAGMLGGLLAALWGGLSLMGFCCRAWAILTLAATSFVLLAELVKGWMSLGETHSPGAVVPALLTLMFVIATGLTAYLPHAGATVAAPADASRGRVSPG